MFGRRRYTTLEKNVVVFTMHKAGSMVLHRVLQDICDATGVRYYSENQSTKKDMLPVRKIFEGKNFIAKRNGCFGPIRFFLPSKGLEETNILLHLRDPRDVLTSMFFSYCFMHRGPVEKNTGYRRAVADAGIDQYVLSMSTDAFMDYEGDYGTGGNYREHIGNILTRYERYLHELVGRPNTALVSYEEMVRDFPSWLRKVVAQFQLANEEEIFQAVLARHLEEVKPAAEDVWAHKRKVTPGDYLEKLNPETVAELNQRFSAVLEALGYSGNAYATTGIPRLAA
jgi:Sulfotransferase domain